MLRHALAATALALGAVTATAAPAFAATAPAVAANAIEQRCSTWQEVTPGVWAIVCLDKSGALFQPIATVMNLSAGPVAVDEFVYLNGVMTNICGSWPNANLPSNGTLRCTNNTWSTAGSPRVASAQFVVGLAPIKTIVAPGFP